MTTEIIQYSTRPYAGEADLALLADIMNICEAHDQLEESVTIDELREEYADPQFDAANNLIIWYDPNGTAIGFSEYHIPNSTAEELRDPAVFVYFKIIPSARRQGLEAAMLELGDQRRREKEQELGIPIQLEAVARDTESERAAEIESLGFSAVRYFLRMVRPITSDLPDPCFPDGFTVRAGELSDIDYVELRNAVWVDHYGYEPWDLEKVRYYRSLNDHDSNLDLIAYDPSGRPAGFCWCSINPIENARNQRQDGWIGILGVRREYRSAGLGRALLREGMRRLRAAGTEYARLGVDGSSPTGATKLYAAEGFEVVYSRTLYSKPS